MPALLHILRSGSFVDMHDRVVSLSPEDVRAMAEGYDPALRPAPIVVGHPKHNSPAFGWIASLAASDGAADGIGCPQGADGCANLQAAPERVAPELAAAVREGRYTAISASLLPPGAPDNPTPGRWYLRHVGFLGGAAPAVPGLRGADLAGADDAHVRTLSFPAPADLAAVIPSPKEPPQEPVMPDGTPPTPKPPENSQHAVDLAAQQARLDEMTARLETERKALADREAELARREGLALQKDIADFCDNVIERSALAPAVRPKMAAVLNALHSDEPVSFAEGDETRSMPSHLLVRELIEALADPKNHVDFAERAGADKRAPTPEQQDDAAIERDAHAMFGRQPKQEG